MMHNWVFVGTEPDEDGFYLKYNCANTGCNLWLNVLIAKTIQPTAFHMIVKETIRKANELTKEKYGCPYVAKTEDQSTKTSMD